MGLAASSFTSVSLEPPLVSFSVANTSRTWPTLRRAGRLGVTVLADHHGEVCRRLAGPVEHRFDDVAVTASGDGAVTLDEGLARFDCSVHREVEAGDHTIVILACTPSSTAAPRCRWSSTAAASASPPAPDGAPSPRARPCAPADGPGSHPA